MLHILTPADFVWEEDVKFTAVNPGDHREAGYFVKIDTTAANEKWRTYVKMEAADVIDATCAVLTTDTARPDTNQGTIISTNPSYSVMGNSQSATVVSDLKGLKIITDIIDGAASMNIGEPVSVVGGKIVAAGTNPEIGVFMGPAESRYGINNAFVVKF